MEAAPTAIYPLGIIVNEYQHLLLLVLETFLVLFIDSSRLSSLTGPGLRAPLSRYLEGALYKFNRQTDRQADRTLDG